MTGVELISIEIFYNSKRNKIFYVKNLQLINDEWERMIDGNHIGEYYANRTYLQILQQFFSISKPGINI